MKPITLPFPPSVNSMFANSFNKSGKGRFKSKAYKAWTKAAGQELQIQRPRRTRGNIDLNIAFAASQRVHRGQKLDISNHIKAVEDLLVQHGIIEDDSLVDGLVVYWTENIESGVRVKVIGGSNVGD